MTSLTTMADIERARQALPDGIRRTPVMPVAPDSGWVGRERLFVKCENLQVTGSYKPRAAFTVLASLTDAQRSRGVVMSSSGNFAQGFAWAGREAGVPITVVMMDQSSPFKVAATRGYGAEVVFCGTSAANRMPTVERLARERGLTPIDVFEHPPIPAGHASIGLEILEDHPDVERILVPVSSGGLAGGIATAVKLTRPQVEVIGVQPDGANATYLSLREGAPVTIDHWQSMADGLAALRPGDWPFRHLQAYLDDIVQVSEQDIADAFRALLFRAKILVEPAGAVAPAAFLGGAVPRDKNTVAVISGGNVAEPVVRTMLEMSAEE